jgi:hypothetical protein
LTKLESEIKKTKDRLKKAKTILGILYFSLIGADPAKMHGSHSKCSPDAFAVETPVHL